MIDTRFNRIFQTTPAQTVFTPGRVNLIGEHTDYNGGMVLPTALDLGLTVAFSPRDDALVRIGSDRFNGLVETSLEAPSEKGWARYAQGAVIFARKAGLITGGADIYIQSSLPDGAGLSSSAALIVAVLKAARAQSNADMTDVDIAMLARRVENDYIGVPCGVMDQMAVAIAHPGQAMALDTKTLTYDLIDLPSDYHFAIIHSGVHRNLSEGRYKERKTECDRARDALGVDNLCLLTDQELTKAETLPDPTRRRVRHCATEHRRTVAAAAALKSGDIATLARLMNDSHASMRDDFEVSLPEIDVLVEDAVRFGAMGARLTGGGFGGCIVACVKNDRLASWKQKLLTEHSKARWVC